MANDKLKPFNLAFLQAHLGADKQLLMQKHCVTMAEYEANCTLCICVAGIVCICIHMHKHACTQVTCTSHKLEFIRLKSATVPEVVQFSSPSTCQNHQV